jgi:hypothetical protein
MSEDLKEFLKKTLMSEFNFPEGDWLSKLVESMVKEITNIPSSGAVVGKILQALSPAFIQLKHPPEVADEGSACMFRYLKALGDWAGIEKWLIKAASLVK